MVQDLAEQYEAYPYPPYHPEQDNERCRTRMNDFIQIGHFLHGGHFPFTDRSRILIAGGGIGDATVDIAEQSEIYDIRPDIVHLDLSSRSNAITEERLTKRGLQDRVEIIQGSLLDLPDGTFGTFDYINCSGVLHHLEDPDEGMRALASVLKDDGDISVMLYALYGRRITYDVQELMQRLRKKDETLAELIPLTRELITALPQSNPLKTYASISKDDSEIVDRYLHFRDRAYTTDQIFDIAAQANLEVCRFIPYSIYQPEKMTRNINLQELLLQKDQKRRYAIGEIMHGNIDRHCFYAAKKAKKAADPLQQNLIPVLAPGIVQLREQHWPNGASFAIDGFPIQLTAIEASVLRYIDEKNTIKDILGHVSAQASLSEEQSRKTWISVFEKLNGIAKLYLKQP